MPVNEQVTDSTTQVNTAVLGSTPAEAMGNLMVPTSHALSNAALNASAAQQQAHLTMHSATVQGLNSLMAIGTAVTGRGAEAISEKG